MTVSSSRREVAVAEKLGLNEHLLISFYTLGKERTRIIKEMKSSTVKLMAYGANDRVLLALSGEPENELIYIEADERPRIAAYSETNFRDVSAIRVNPAIPTVVSISGKNTFKIFRL